MTDLPAAVDWFATKCCVTPGFTAARMAVLTLGTFTLILDAATADSNVTVGFNSVDCRRDFDMLVGRGAESIQPPQDREYGARVAYLKGPGGLTIELEQML